MTTEKKDDKLVQRQELTPAQRFTQTVIKHYQSGVGALQLDKRQERLTQSYFVAVDHALKDAEGRRIKKSEQYRDKVPVTWNNVNIEELAISVVACSRIGFDPSLPNHVFFIPYKNNTTGKYDINLMEGYRGKEIKARKYGYDVPSDIVVELVYSNDKFDIIKKDLNNDVEGYLFEVANPFERGDIIGGFYYFKYSDDPSKNILRVFNKTDIEKRKPGHASPEFWGGEKDKWENGKKVGKEAVDGWYEEMMWKTLFRAAMNAIAIDSEKIDDNLARLLKMDAGEVTDEPIAPKVEKPTKTFDIGDDTPYEEVTPEEQPKDTQPLKKDPIMEDEAPF